jgi:hypothetical protein
MFCASIVLLAHAVVPHHHHDDFACFIYSEEAGQDDCCDQKDADHQKKHDTDSTNDCCILNDILAVIPLTYKQEDLNFDFSCMLINTNHYISMIVVPDIYQEQVISYKDFRQRPFLVNSFEVYASHSLGLRAPPYC